MALEKRDILLLCQFFYPEYNSSATLPFDTARYLSAQGVAVDALAGYPKEYSRERQLPLRETVDGVRIRRLRYIQTSRKGKLGRLVNFFSFTLHALLRVRRLKAYKAVIVYSNPPILPVVALLSKSLYGTKLVFVAYDIYPEIAYASGTLKEKGLISQVMRRINRWLYRSADRVVALTDEMKEFLLSNRNGLSEERVAVIPNWAHECTCVAAPKAYARFGYRADQFIVSYFGNLGTCQDVETMIEAAELLRKDDRVRFLIIGHGNKMPMVQTRIRERGLENVQLLDFLTDKAFQQAVAISSCSIVSLEKGLKGTCAPSKYYSYLQGGMPILAVMEEDSYLVREVEQERIGRGIRIGDGPGLMDAILSLAEDATERARMGERARRLYETKYAYPLAMKKYGQLVRELLESERTAGE